MQRNHAFVSRCRFRVDEGGLGHSEGCRSQVSPIEATKEGRCHFRIHDYRLMRSEYRFADCDWHGWDCDIEMGNGGLEDANAT